MFVMFAYQMHNTAKIMTKVTQGLSFESGFGSNEPFN